jgi:predicted SAM-dependent methyltransferase
MRLNLACRDDIRSGFINVDIEYGPGVNVVADVRDLHCWPDESAVQIVAQDILEHFPAAQTQDILAEWRRLLKPGGHLDIRVPNMLVLATYLSQDNPHWATTPMDPVQIIENIYGGHRYGPDGCFDAHHTGWTPRMLKAELEQAGFKVLRQDTMPNFYTYAVKP